MGFSLRLILYHAAPSPTTLSSRRTPLTPTHPQRMRRAEVLKGLLAKAPVVEEKKKAEIEQKESAAAAKKRQDAEREEAKLRQMTKAERLAYIDKQKAAEREKAIQKAAKAQKKK